jgi:hypothetical protein
MFLIQSWISVPLTIRKLFSNLVVFKPNKIEWEKVVEETIEQEKDVALALLDLYKKPHDYLFINVPTQKIFYNQDEVEILDDELTYSERKLTYSERKRKHNLEQLRKKRIEKEMKIEAEKKKND